MPVVPRGYLSGQISQVSYIFQCCVVLKLLELFQVMQGCVFYGVQEARVVHHLGLVDRSPQSVSQKLLRN